MSEFIVKLTEGERRKLLRFAKEEFNKLMWKDADGDTALTQALQFADDFMERCDKLDKKVNDLARDKRELSDTVRDLNNIIEEMECKRADLEKENAELREEKKELCESMLNVIGCVRLVSKGAYKCIHRDFIKKLEEQGE